MRRYRVTFRLDGPGIGRRLKSTNVAATDPADAVMRAVRALTGYPAHRITVRGDRSEVNGVVTAERGGMRLYANQMAYWADDPAEAWLYEVLLDEPSTFDLAGLVRMGQILAPIPPRP